jgi:hypothetical protein
LSVDEVRERIVVGDQLGDSLECDGVLPMRPAGGPVTLHQHFGVKGITFPSNKYQNHHICSAHVNMSRFGSE